MFSHLKLENIAAFRELEWRQHSQINVVIGENDTGKTYLLKLLYCLARSVEEHAKRAQAGPAISWAEVLSDKLLWTFQPEGWELGKLVRKGESGLKVQGTLDQTKLHFGFGRGTTKQIKDVSQVDTSAISSNALFISPKEVLTAFNAIAATREQLQIPGFDDTYLDLIKALRLPTTRGAIQQDLRSALDTLVELTGGGEIRREKQAFVFKRGNERYAMPEVAEGIKKIGILNILIRNRLLSKHSILFVDEPETNLHPKAIIALVNMLFHIARAGIQVYLATHSYFVLKQLELMARRYGEPIALCSLSRTRHGAEAQFHDLRKGMPPNPIVDVSVGLYEEEVRLDIEA